MPDLIEVMAGDTEPLEIDIDARGLDDLTEVSSAKLYMKKQGAATNHIDGATCTITDVGPLSNGKAGRISFDPVDNAADGNNAFGPEDAGAYSGYVLITYSDSDETRHKKLWAVVEENFE